MIILGIETSCDETSAALVRDGEEIIANVVATSLKEHEKYGGVIPEIASRRQLESITAVVEEAMHKADLGISDIDAVAVTKEPGLIGSLLVGISFARALGWAAQKPVVDVNHIEAHMYACFLRPEKTELELPSLPAVGLVVSGGHTSLYLIKEFRSFELLGQTRDDAAGEAYDKVARIMGLGYPGGPVIDRLARSCISTDVKFTPAKMSGSYDFSFSGIKTAVLYHLQKNPEAVKTPEKIACAFQKSVVDILVEKCLTACEGTGVRTIVAGGGVAANSSLRDILRSESEKKGIKVFFPPIPLCMDNAAMIAGLGFHLLKQEKEGPNGTE
jgi:N6-L-threonylcarbamoyladenine synthase